MAAGQASTVKGTSKRITIKTKKAMKKTSGTRLTNYEQTTRYRDEVYQDVFEQAENFKKHNT